MLGRDGVGTAAMLAALGSSAESGHLLWGGLIGLALDVDSAWAWVWVWVRFGKSVDLRRFFRVTAWFMVVFAI